MGRRTVNIPILFVCDWNKKQIKKGETEKMKYLVLVLAVLVCITGLVYSAQEDTLTISVTITGASLSVDITEASWNVNAGVNATVESSSFTVTNNSGGLTETYQIKASTTNWDLGSSAGENTCVLSAVVKASGSSSATFGSDDIVTTSYQNCSDTVFGDSSPSGANVVSGGVRSLLLQLKTPTSVTQTTDTITLYVKAVTP